jgi:hypothetical protein
MDYVGGIAQNIGCLWKCNPLIIGAIGSGVNSLFLYRGGFAARVGRRRPLARSLRLGESAIPTLGSRWALSRHGAVAPFVE